MEKHTLFTLKPGFYDGDEGPFYCPHSVVIEGMLVYVPELENLVDIHRIDFTRPRPAVIELLGEENQSSPVLVLAEGSEVPPEAKISETTSRAFIDNEFQIAKFLSKDLGVMGPH
jgi:hypothetical protein